ncbi:Zn-C6 fungal-type DNA-binding domain protein [Pyrenophora teres f. maculata]|nr:Zn-C6 fungal-type DNA-binding domain protein [Pyrenophora teres f. maculata]
MATSPSRPLPQLLPAPPGARKQPATQPKKPQVSAACNNCRARKIKCNGERPKCTQCATKDIPCVYTETESRQVKRKYQELREKRSAYEKLFDLIKTMSEPDAIDVLRRIRAGGNVQAILNQINDGNLLMQLSLVPERRHRYDLPRRMEMPAFILTENNSYLKSVVYENTFRTSESVSLPGVKESAMNMYLMPYSSAVMADPLLSRVTTAKWTTIITDNNLLRQLLSAYFTYQHPSLVYLHKDLFLQAMADGRDQFCSPLLVNAILAAGCQSSLVIHDSTQFWNPHTLGYLFLAEAKRLWELECSESRSLTTIQAALVLQMALNENGLDRIGLSYMLHALLIAKDIDLFQKPKWPTDEEMMKARIVTAWGFFNWQSMYCYYFFRTSFLDRPPDVALPDPGKYPQWYGEVWLRYPNSKTLASTHLGSEFGARSALRVIMMDMSIALYGPPERKGILTLDQILGFHFRLNAWFTSLSDPLTPQKIVYPTQMELHLEYHCLLLQLCRLDGAIQIKEPSASAIFKQKFDRIASEARISVETLLRIYYMRHGFEVHNTFSVWIQVFVGNLAIEALRHARKNSSGDSTMIDVHRSTLVLCAVGLHSQGLSYQLGKLAFRALQVCMTPEDLQLVRTYCTPGEEAEQSLLLQHTQSLWPVPIININENPETALLNGLLKEYQDLDLDIDGKSRSISSNSSSSSTFGGV